MRPQKIDDEKLMAALTQVFRAKGYEGASLNDIAKACGLQKASLYHRFPGGKKEMVSEVLAHVAEWVKVNILDVLTNTSALPNDRLEAALQNIQEFYNYGQNSCLLRMLSMEPSLNLFEEKLQRGMKNWLAAFTDLGISFGSTEEEAKLKALEVLISIQGSLVVCKTLDSTEPFLSTIERIRKIYLKID